MRSLSVLLLSLAACGGVNTGQALEHPASPEAVLGRGFESLSGRARGDCVVPHPVQSATRRVDRLVEEVFYARSKEEILREIGYSGGINFGLFGVGVNLGFESLNRKLHTASTSFAVVRIHIESPSRTLVNYRLKKSAVDTLRREGPGKFYEQCGDGFVAAIRQGGYFLGIIALDGVSDAETRRLSGSAGVSFLGVGLSGGAHSERRDFLERHRARYYIIQEGGEAVGMSSLRELESIDALLLRAERFKYAVTRGQGVPTRLIVEPYQVTSNRPRRAELWSLVEQRRFLDQLAVEYGELQRADAEVKERLASPTCTRKTGRNKLEKLHRGYEQAIPAVRQRAEDCVTNPRRQCSDRGLDFVDPGDHRKAMTLCADGSELARGEAARTDPAPKLRPPRRRPGDNMPYQPWQPRP